MDKELQLATLGVRAGTVRSQFQEHSEALFLTSGFVFDNAAQAATRFAGSEEGMVYTRYTNPTVAMFQDRLAALEGAQSCVATASGMAAILASALVHLKSGDHVVCSNAVFGATIQLFNNILARFGVETTYVSPTRAEEWQRAVRPTTRLFFLETPSNPLTEVSDIPALAAVAKKAGALLAVDNVFCTPVLQRPLELGADLVIHSATKYLDGQGRVLGGGGLQGAGRRADDRVPAHGRAGPFTVQRVGAAEGPRDARAAHARAVGRSPRAGAVARAPPVGGPRALSGTRVASAARARRTAAAGGGLGAFLRGERWARGRLACNRCDPPHVDHREPGRREDDDHPPGDHHARAHLAAGAAGRGHHRRAGARRRRARGPGRSTSGSGARVKLAACPTPRFARPRWRFSPRSISPRPGWRCSRRSRRATLRPSGRRRESRSRRFCCGAPGSGPACGSAASPPT